MKRAITTTCLDDVIRSGSLKTRGMRQERHDSRRMAMGSVAPSSFKLMLAAERSWRRLNGAELLPLVRAGVPFRDGVRVEREEVAPMEVKSQRRTKKIQESVMKVAA